MMINKLILVFMVASFLTGCGVKPKSLHSGDESFPASYPTKEKVNK